MTPLAHAHRAWRQSYKTNVFLPKVIDLRLAKTETVCHYGTIQYLRISSRFMGPPSQLFWQSFLICLSNLAPSGHGGKPLIFLVHSKRAHSGSVNHHSIHHTPPVSEIKKRLVDDSLVNCLLKHQIIKHYGCLREKFRWTHLNDRPNFTAKALNTGRSGVVVHFGRTKSFDIVSS